MVPESPHVRDVQDRHSKLGSTTSSNADPVTNWGDGRPVCRDHILRVTGYTGFESKKSRLIYDMINVGMRCHCN